MEGFCNEFEAVDYTFSIGDTIGNIISLLCDDINFQADDVMLYYKSVYLKESQTLSFYNNIKDNSTIRVVQKSFRS